MEWRRSVVQSLKALGDLHDIVKEGFDLVDRRLEGIEQRLDGVDQRLDRMAEDIHTIKTLLGIANLDPEAVKAAVFADRISH